MYAMTGKLVAQSGKRGELVEILRQAAGMVAEISECHLYIVSEDMGNDSHVWVFEAWTDKQAHDASLSREDVRTLIAKAKPMLAAAPDGAELRVAGGHGILLQ